MPDYNKLEQLNRLRQSGGLSSEEYEREKAKLLAASAATASPGRMSRQIAIGLIIGACAVAAIVLVIFLTSGERTGPSAVKTVASSITSNESTTPGEALPAVAPTAIAVVPSTAALSAQTIDWAFNSDKIGMNPSFVETKLGPAKNKTRVTWTFEVQGCDIDFGITGGSITTVGMRVTKTCSPMVEDRRVTPQTTFGQISISNGTLRSSCIYGCGNAYDPTIDLFVPAYHANGFIETLYTSSNGQPQDDAATIWTASIITAHGLGAGDDDKIDVDWFSCVSTAPATANMAMAKEKIGYVTLGRNISTDGCKYKD